MALISARENYDWQMSLQSYFKYEDQCYTKGLKDSKDLQLRVINYHFIGLVKWDLLQCWSLIAEWISYFAKLVLN